MIDQIEHALRNLRGKHPLVLCLTNVVTMDFMANVLLALGAAPMMSSNDAELDELLQISGAIYVNIGTLDECFMVHSYKALDLAKKYSKPLILDPVGAGASHIRTELALSLSPHASIIRGNASEIMAIQHGGLLKSKGVEALHTVHEAKLSAANLSASLKTVVVVSGEEDFVVDKTNAREKEFKFGSELMPKITGMGCSLTAVMAAFAAVTPDPFEAAFIAAAYFSLCGSIAAKKANKPGSFRVAFIDALYEANFKEMKDIIHAV